MIIYYTGTGNSRYCAEYLAAKLGDECVNAFDYIRNGIAAELISGKPWVFVTPTYAWRLPRVFESFMKSGSFEGEKAAYFVMNCGEDIGNAGEYNAALCRELGLEYRGTQAVVMPENYIAMFDAPESDEAEKIILAAHLTLEKAAELIAAGACFPEHKATMSDKLKSGLVNKSFYKLFVNAKRFTVSDKCISCGKCESGCPTKSVTIENGRPVWGEGCTHCMACICGCPVGAIEYGKISLGKPRYQCPQYNK